LLKYLDTERNRAGCNAKESETTDHIVELQLVVAALNMLPDTTYSREQLIELVGFFNGGDNLQCMTEDKNRKKGRAVKKFINKGFQALNDKQQ